MSATIQRTVTTDTLANTTQNPNFEWVNVDGVLWVTRSDSTQANTSDFLIATNTSNAVRTSQWEVRHWNYVNDNTLVDSFTITQDADGVVSTTTTTTSSTTLPEFTCSEANPQIAQGVEGQQIDIGDVSLDEGTLDGVTPANYVAGTNNYEVDIIIPVGYQNAGGTITCENISATASATTSPPVNYTLTLASGTSGAQAVQFTEASPNSQSINYTQSPNSGTPAVLVDSLPAWLTSGGITGSAIQLSLNSDPSTYPADSAGFSMTYRHGDAPVGQGEDELYVEFVAAPSNTILVTSTNVNPVSEAPSGEGESTYTDNNSGDNATQAVVYQVNMDPDVDLTSSEVYWSTTLPSASGHQASPSPYWATTLNIDNTPSTGQAQISYSHVDPNASGSLPTGNKNAPLTEETAGTQSSGPGIILTNQRYVIATHPDDTSHWVAILVTAPNASITTTQAPVTRTFHWDTSQSFTGYGTNVSFTFSYGPGGSVPELLDGSFTISAGSEVDASAVSDPQNHTTLDSSGNGSADFAFSAANPEGSSSEILTITWTPPSYVTLDSSSSATTMITWNPTCIVENEPILMADGTTKLVQNIVVGDELASLNIDTLGNQEDAYLTWSTDTFNATNTTATVTSFSPGQYTKYMNFNSGALKITHEHPILVDRSGTFQFIAARDVQVGDKFLIEQTWTEITSAEEIIETVKTYTIGCEDADVYFANGVLVHNTIDPIKD